MVAHIKLKIASFAIVAAIVGVNAQTSSAAAAIPSGITPCAFGCISGALSAGGCTSITDIQCLCTSGAFQTAAAQCLQSQCTPADQAAFNALQTSECVGFISVSSGGGSAASSITSAAASQASSLSSVKASDLSSIASKASSLSSSASAALSSATNPSSSSSGGAATSSSAAGNAAPLVGIGGLVGVAVVAIGVVAGAGLVL